MNEDILTIATEFAAKHPDFLENFLGMVDEYRHIAQESGTDLSELPLTVACLTAVHDLLVTLEGK